MGRFGLAWLLAGCSPDPLQSAPWPGGEGSSWYEVRLGEDLLGVEERVRIAGIGGEQDCRRRWQRVRVGSSLLDLVDGECWLAGGGRSGQGGAARPIDGFTGPLGSGRVGLPFGAEIEAEVVRVEDGDETWVMATWAGPAASARFDGAGLVEGRQGEVSWSRVATRPPDWEPIDIQARLAVPVPPVERPRSRRVGRYRVDGEALSVDAPLDAELPRLPLPPPRSADVEVRAFVARSVVASDVVSAVGQLAGAVARAIDDEVVPGRATGPSVLASRRGDCTEHTALFLDGALALGLEARPVAGLLYLEDGSAGAAFYPHAWAEVQVGSRWVAVDPTLGTWPADAARVPLDARIDVAMDRVAKGLRVEVVELR